MRIGRYWWKALALLTVTVMVTLLHLRWREHALWRAESMEIQELLTTLETPAPDGITPLAWHNAVTRLQAGYMNACFSETWISGVQLHDLRLRLEPMVQQPHSIEGLVDIWDEIGESSDMAREHIVKFRSDFLDYLPEQQQ